ncbi:MAG: DUF5050 domain-containing protein [Oscillospiraceae bacterium]|nr:DUF5050 domain-containing protein [Oscillospiraceae bacterium]
MLKTKKLIACFLALAFILPVFAGMPAFSAAAENVLIGDVDGDGEVGAADARMILRHVAKLELLNPEQMKRADVNGNGEIDASAARQVLRFTAKLVDKFAAVSASPVVNERGNTVGNIVNWGHAAIQGEWIYFRNSKDDDKLYKINVDGSGKKKLGDDESVNSINVIGEWIYYCYRETVENINSPRGIYKIKTDGTERQMLVDANDAAFINVIGDYIYFGNYAEGGICRVKIDGSEKKLLTDDYAMYINVVDDWIYYSYRKLNGGDNGVNRIKTDGTAKQKLNDDPSTHINVVGDWIYYQKNPNYGGMAGLYRIKTDGTVKQEIKEESYAWGGMTVSDGWIYCAYYAGMIRVKIDGTDEQKLTDEFMQPFSIINDGIYYYHYSDSDNTISMYRIKTDGSETQLVD